MQKSTVYLALSVLLSACGGGDSGEVTNQGSSIVSTSPLFDDEWFSFNHAIVFDISLEASDTKRYNYSVYKDRISKDSEQVLQYTATSVVGKFPFFLSTGVENPVYNPYSSLYEIYTVTPTHLLETSDVSGTVRKKSILLNDSSSEFTLVPYNAQLYKNSAATTIQYNKYDLSGVPVATAIDSVVTDAYDASILKLKKQDSSLDTSFISVNTANLTKLKNSALTFPVGAVGVKQISSTPTEDQLIFSRTAADYLGDISDWKASYGTNVVFKDYLWSGQSFSCVVDIHNVPTGDCAVNYDGATFRASYLTKGVSTQKPNYILFNKKAADVLEAAFKQYLISPTE